MSGLKIEVDWDVSDKITIESLKFALSHLSTRPKYGIFHSDEAEDLKEMKKMRNAIKIVLSYYGVNNNET